MNKQPKEYKKYLESALTKGTAYFQYEDFTIPIKQNVQYLSNYSIERYEIIDKIGRGKYSDVYKSMLISNTQKPDKLSVLKILKPIRQGKIKREIKILKTLKHQSIIELEAVMFDQCSKSYILAMDFVQTSDSTKTPIYTAQQIKLFIYKILQGLDYCHSMGIMHRDIKPQNILIDQKKGIVKMVDWGLADYYLPNKQYNVRVASRYFKGPELLLNNKFYDYSLDIWSLGCMFAGMIFKKGVIFKGDDNADQLKKILEFFGSVDIEIYLNKYKLKPDQKVRQYIDERKYPRHKFQQLINADNSSLASEKALDLLKRMLVIDHMDRITAMEALTHSFFDSVKNV